MQAASTEKQAKVLIVDDTAANLKLLIRILADRGYTVHAANSGQAALEFMELHLPDIVLLDVMMPGIDGYEVCRRMKETDRTKDIPVVFVSAMDAAWDKVKAFGLGAVDYIVKPIEENEVLARLETHLSLRNLRLNLEQMVQARTAELMRAKEELLENQRLLKAIIDSSQAVIYVKNLDGSYRLVNRRFEELSGKSSVDLCGLRDEQIFTQEVAAVLREADQLVIRSGESIEAEETYPHGEELHTYVSVKAPLRDLAGQMYAICGIATDITDRVREQHALLELNELLERRLAERGPTRGGL